jgi:hypothetical protein
VGGGKSQPTRVDRKSPVGCVPSGCMNGFCCPPVSNKAFAGAAGVWPHRCERHPDRRIHAALVHVSPARRPRRGRPDTLVCNVRPPARQPARAFAIFSLLRLCFCLVYRRRIRLGRYCGRDNSVLMSHPDCLKPVRISPLSHFLFNSKRPFVIAKFIFLVEDQCWPTARAYWACHHPYHAPET